MKCDNTFDPNSSQHQKVCNATWSSVRPTVKVDTFNFSYSILTVSNKLLSSYLATFQRYKHTEFTLSQELLKGGLKVGLTQPKSRLECFFIILTRNTLP